MDLLPLLALVSILACLLCLVSYRKAIRSSRLPPSAYAWQLVRNMSMSPLASLANLAQIYGPIFSLRVGALFIIVASSPETVMEILKARDHIFSGSMMVSRDLIDIERECKGRNQRLMGFIEAIMLDVLGTPSAVDLFPTLDGLLGLWERRKATKLHQEFKSLWGSY
ncbi:UNVERIFIED_CONTAM: hypothetical protein Slati_2900100 [Sesamum latifolium]|uniref:Cytochrome P450 n=1 Tax=Sesamum latifolium TaxID=2727402 RepID=A0AAW2VDF1_9LAMI